MIKKFTNSGDALRSLRVDKMKLTQLELAVKVGVHTQMVSNWERGLCAPPKNKLKKLFSGQPENIKYAYASMAILDAEVRTKEELAKVGLWPS